MVIGRETLERADRHRFEFLSQQAGTLAEKFVLAHTAADARKRAFLADLVESPGKIALRHEADELFDVDVQWASFNAGRILALQAAKRLNLNLLERKTQRNLGGTAQPYLRRKNRQSLTRSFRIGFHSGAGSQAPEFLL